MTRTVRKLRPCCPVNTAICIMAKPRIFLQKSSVLALNPNFDTMGGIESFVMRRLSGNKTQGFRRILNSCHLVTEFLVIRSDYGVALFRPRCSVSSLVVWLKLLFPKALQRGHSIFAVFFFRFLIQVNRPVQILFHTQALFI